MRFDADLALSHARFIGPDTAQQELFDSLAGFPQAQIGNGPGNFNSNAARGQDSSYTGTLRLTAPFFFDALTAGQEVT
jgi:hypothetical protein